MIQIFPAESRFISNHGWLKSAFSFSFAEYFDPNNINFGHLRVLNDDIVQPTKGFGAHPHQEMEIVSIILRGYLQHQDSAGHIETTTFGGVQRMTAGTGIVHSEINPSEDEEVNFLQLWFIPDTKGLTPSYENTKFNPLEMKNALLPIVSNRLSSEKIAKIHQDLTIYLADFDQNKELIFSQVEDRKIFLFVIEGELTLNDEKTLSRRDSARITSTPQLKIKAEKDAQFMLIDLQ